MAAPLAVCLACSQENPSGARYCARCGSPQTPAHDAHDDEAQDRAERRQLTVMFCDLEGSSELAQRLDPEEYREVVRAYQNVAQKTFERYDGHLAQYLGDGILAYFGYPQGHEDNAERAVRAGLELLGELERMNGDLAREQLRARIGIHTGTVVLGEMGTGSQRVTLALGETTNVAARIQAEAEPGTLLISQSTLQLVPGLFLTRDLGSRRLKGIGAPVAVYRVLQGQGVRSRLDVASRRTPLVGRTGEIEFLLDRWARARAGDGQVVEVVGEAGLGKSRLVALLRERLAGRPHSWLECHCSPFSSSSVLHPVLELIRQACRFDESASPEAKRLKLEEALELYGFHLEETAPVFVQLLGLPRGDRYAAVQEDPALVRRRALEALVVWTRAIAAQQPTVLLIEDLHWSDPTTRELLTRLLERCGDAPILMVLTQRPDFVAPWPKLPHASRLVLTRLSPEQARELAAKASPRVLPEEVLDRVVERADGIPLFIEELVRMLLDRPAARNGGGEVSIPPTIQDSLTARLDALGEARELAQLAATLGRDFSYPLLAAVADRSEEQLKRELARLVEADLLYRSGSPPNAEYGFRHVLLQETAYASLLKRQRSRMHGRIAHALVSRFPERAAEEPETLAHHWMEAGEWSQAAETFAGVGREAARAAGYREAVVHTRRALEALGHEKRDRERDRRELSLRILLGHSMMAAQGYSTPEALPIWERAVALAERLGDPAELSSAVTGLAAWWNSTGNCVEALRHARRTLEIAKQAKERTAALRGCCSLALVHLYVGEPRKALHHARQVIALYRPSDYEVATYGIGSDQGVLARGVAAFALFLLGQPDRALAPARDGVALAKQLGSPLSLAMARIFLGMIHHMRGEPQRAVALAEEVIDSADALGFPDWLGFGMLLAGVERTHLEEGPDGADEALEGLAILGDTGNRGGAPFGLELLAEAQSRAGRLEDALETIRGALELSHTLGQPVADADLLRMQAELLLARNPGAPDESERLFRQALDVARAHGERAFVLRAATSYARLLRDRERQDEARTLLREATAPFHEGFATRDLREAQALMGALG